MSTAVETTVNIWTISSSARKIGEAEATAFFSRAMQLHGEKLTQGISSRVFEVMRSI